MRMSAPPPSDGGGLYRGSFTLAAMPPTLPGSVRSTARSSPGGAAAAPRGPCLSPSAAPRTPPPAAARALRPTASRRERRRGGSAAAGPPSWAGAARSPPPRPPPGRGRPSTPAGRRACARAGAPASLVSFPEPPLMVPPRGRGEPPRPPAVGLQAAMSITSASSETSSAGGHRARSPGGRVTAIRPRAGVPGQTGTISFLTSLCDALLCASAMVTSSHPSRMCAHRLL